MTRGLWSRRMAANNGALFVLALAVCVTTAACEDPDDSSLFTFDRCFVEGLIKAPFLTNDPGWGEACRGRFFYECPSGSDDSRCRMDNTESQPWDTDEGLFRPGECLLGGICDDVVMPTNVAVPSRLQIGCLLPEIDEQTEEEVWRRLPVVQASDNADLDLEIGGQILVEEAGPLLLEAVDRGGLVVDTYQLQARRIDSLELRLRREMEAVFHGTKTPILSLAHDATVDLRVVAFDEHGETLAGILETTWSIADANVVAVEKRSPFGRQLTLRALAPGQTTATATVGTVSLEVEIEVKH